MSDCIPWTGYIGPRGYGLVAQPKHGTRYAHRVAYMDAHGKLPSSIPLDHTCHTVAALAGECAGGDACPHRGCVNPEHLEPTTTAENVRRGLRSYSARTVCRSGLHDLTEPGAVYITPSTGGRTCRACMLANNRRYRARRRAGERAA